MLFDFGQVADSPIYTIDVSIRVESGHDLYPMECLRGVPVLVASPSAGVLDAAVRVLIGGALPGVVYIVRCVVETLRGKQLIIESRWKGEASHDRRTERSNHPG